MRYANTKFLIVTRYCMVRSAVVPSKCLRYAFALPSLYPRSTLAFKPNRGTDLKRTYNGLTTEVQRNCIGGSWKALAESH